MAVNITTNGLIERTGTAAGAARAIGVGAGTSIPTKADVDTLIAASALGVSTFENMAALVAQAGTTGGSAVLDGYYERGDGGGGVFTWDEDSTEDDDGGVVINPTGAGAGRWVRSNIGTSLNVRWFGAKLDGTTDDTAAIQAALDTKKGAVFIPPVQPLSVRGAVITQIVMYEGSKLFGVGAGTYGNFGSRLWQKDGSDIDMIVNDASAPPNHYLHSTHIENLLLEGLGLRSPSGLADPGSAAAGGCGINFTHFTGETFEIRNVRCRYFRESGIRIGGGSTPGLITNCASFWNDEYGFELTKPGGRVWHLMGLRSISGDNNGLGVLRIHSVGQAYDVIFVDGVKSETSTIAGIDDGDIQQDVIVLDTLNNHPVSISNVANYCGSGNTMNSVIKIVNSGARVILRNIRSHTDCDNYIDDQSASQVLARTGSASHGLVDGFWSSALGADAYKNVRLVADYTADGSLTQDIQDYVDAQTVLPTMIFKGYGVLPTANAAVEQIISEDLVTNFAVDTYTTYKEIVGVDTAISHQIVLKCSTETDQTGDVCRFEISLKNRETDADGSGAYGTANASADVTVGAGVNAMFDVVVPITQWNGLGNKDVAQYKVERVAKTGGGTEAADGILLHGAYLEQV